MELAVGHQLNLLGLDGEACDTAISRQLYDNWLPSTLIHTISTLWIVGVVFIVRVTNDSRCNLEETPITTVNEE